MSSVLTLSAYAYQEALPFVLAISAAWGRLRRSGRLVTIKMASHPGVAVEAGPEGLGRIPGRHASQGPRR
jgi:hypothetical protein